VGRKIIRHHPPGIMDLHGARPLREKRR
jgi:hypothetical protein